MTKPRKTSLLELRDKPEPGKPQRATRIDPAAHRTYETPERVPSRVGRKAMTGYFPPELSLAMRTTAMRHGITLQEAMGEAMNDWLRKMGESPVGM